MHCVSCETEAFVLMSAMFGLCCCQALHFLYAELLSLRVGTLGTVLDLQALAGLAGVLSFYNKIVANEMS